MFYRNLIASFADEGNEVPLKQVETRAPIARRVFMDLLRAYGRSQKVVDFFEIYAELYDIYNTEEDEQPAPKRKLFNRFRRDLRQIEARTTEEATRNYLDVTAKRVEQLLRRVDAGSQLPNSVWRELAYSYAGIIQSLGADKGVYLRTRRLPGPHPLKWPRLQKASKKEEKQEKFRINDPEAYDRLQQEAWQKREIRERIDARIVSDGLIPKTKVYFRGVPVQVGEDPNTGEVTVYDQDGETLTPEEFISKFKLRTRARRRMRVNPAKYMESKYLDVLRKADEGQIEDALARPLFDGEVRFMSITDDPGKDSSITRIYPVRKIEGEYAVVGGRFKGFMVRDLVNAAGRQIEGSSFVLDPDNNSLVRRSIRNEDGSVNIRRSREPYVTLSGDTLVLKMGNERKDKVLRAMMDQLSVEIPSIRIRGKYSKKVYLFGPKDFNVIRDRLGSMAMSQSAARFLQEYFEDLAKAQLASESVNLARFSSDALGFKLPMRTHSKRALAWLEANGDKGTVALDTGMGKTVTALASMMNLIQRGAAGSSRFLFVCDTDLLGNFPKEVRKFMRPKDAQALLGRVDVISYTKFNKSRREDLNFGEDYAAIYFDEAHKRMVRRTQAAYQAAVNCRTRKVLLTASPCVKSPVESFTLASVANGLDLNLPENREEERKFMDFYTTKVGGRITGVTQDPEAARDFRVWVKRNIFYMQKTEVVEEEARLKPLRKETVAVRMPPLLEAEYRMELAQVIEGLQEMVADYEGQVPLAFEAAARRIRNPLKRLMRLTDSPNRAIPGMPNPKIDRSVSIIKSIPMQRRTLLFSDSKDLAHDTFQRMVEQFPGRGHVLGLTDRIIYVDPKGGETVYRKRIYKDPETGEKMNPDEWKTHVLTFILGLGLKRTQKAVMTATLTGSYAVGQNLQSFGTVIHLDRDGWSNETMKQRTARAWRSGNKKVVDEYTVDLVFGDTVADDDADKTLDEIRRIIQDLDEDLFNQVILDSQSERLGVEWFEMKQKLSEAFRVENRLLERALSPYAKHLGELEDEV